MDEFLGEGLLNMLESTSTGDIEVNLYSKTKNNTERVRLKGTIYVSLVTVDFVNFMEL